MQLEIEYSSQIVPASPQKKKYVRKTKSKVPNHDKAVGDMTVTELKEALIFYRQKIEAIQTLLREVTIETQSLNTNKYGDLYGNNRQLAEERVTHGTPLPFLPSRSVDLIENNLVEYGGTPADSYVEILPPGLSEDQDY